MNRKCILTIIVFVTVISCERHTSIESEDKLDIESRMIHYDYLLEGPGGKELYEYQKQVLLGEYGKEPKHALQFLIKAVDLGNPRAQIIMAEKIINSEGNNEIPFECYGMSQYGAVENLLKKADNAESYDLLGEIHLNGLLRQSIDIDKAIEFFETASSKGNIMSWSTLAKIYFDRGNFQKAFYYSSLDDVVSLYVNERLAEIREVSYKKLSLKEVENILEDVDRLIDAKIYFNTKEIYPDYALGVNVKRIFEEKSKQRETQEEEYRKEVYNYFR